MCKRNAPPHPPIACFADPLFRSECYIDIQSTTLQLLIFYNARRACVGCISILETNDAPSWPLAARPFYGLSGRRLGIELAGPGRTRHAATNIPTLLGRPGIARCAIPSGAAS